LQSNRSAGFQNSGLRGWGWGPGSGCRCGLGCYGGVWARESGSKVEGNAVEERLQEQQIVLGQAVTTTRPQTVETAARALRGVELPSTTRVFQGVVRRRSHIHKCPQLEPKRQVPSSARGSSHAPARVRARTSFCKAPARTAPPSAASATACVWIAWRCARSATAVPMIRRLHSCRAAQRKRGPDEARDEGAGQLGFERLGTPHTLRDVTYSHHVIVKPSHVRCTVRSRPLRPRNPPCPSNAILSFAPACSHMHAHTRTPSLTTHTHTLSLSLRLSHTHAETHTQVWAAPT
jgi:hypothetical protein